MARSKAFTTSADRKATAERLWEATFTDACKGTVNKQQLITAMTMLNTADYLLNKERSFESERRLKLIVVDENSPENKSIESKRQCLWRILQEIIDCERDG